MNPLYYNFLFQTQHEDLVKKANQQLYVKTAPSDKPKIQDRVKTKVGELLIQIGSRLQHLPAPKNPSFKTRNIA